MVVEKGDLVQLWCRRCRAATMHVYVGNGNYECPICGLSCKRATPS